MDDRATNHIPAMIKFMRRRLAEEVYTARQAPAGDPLAALVLADVAARRALLYWIDRWAERRDGGTWQAHPEENPAARAVRHGMEDKHEMQGFALRYLLTRYTTHPRFRPEWRVPH